MSVRFQLPAETVPAQRTGRGHGYQKRVMDCFAPGPLVLLAPRPMLRRCLLLFPRRRDPGKLRRTKCGGRGGKGTYAIGSRTRLRGAAGTTARKSLDAAPQLPR